MTDDDVDFFGLKVSRLTEREVVRDIVAKASERRGGWLITANLDILRLACANKDIRTLCDGASMIVPDGMPLLWSARLRRRPLPERVTGASLIFTLSEAALSAKMSIAIIGGAEGAADAAAHRLTAPLQGEAEPRVTAIYPPHGFTETPDGVRSIVDQVHREAPSIVFVGLGFPKQEHLIEILRAHHPDAWYIGVGAAINFLSGHAQRASPRIQRLGLEWFHRLIAEPRRMFVRYVVKDLPFFVKLLGWSLAHDYSGHPVNQWKGRRVETIREERLGGFP